jgi:hypothetical protein
MSRARKHHGRFFSDEDFEFMAEIALGATYHRGADIGECLATIALIKNGDAESWFSEWSAVGERLATKAADAERAGHARSAADAWLRAATYLDTATAFLDSTKDPDRMHPAWDRHRDAWDGFVRTSPGIEAVQIPYEDAELDGWIFRADAGEAPRPLLILNNGSDGAASAMWMQGAAGGTARGYDCLSFDGPGQGSALWRKEIPFRPDWEAVINPVVDYALTLDGIDADRIALHGVSQGGYWVPRAVAFEKRIAAAVADPGVWDVGGSWRSHIPKSMLKQLADGERDKFNRNMDWGTRFSRTTRGSLAFRMRPFGLETPFDVYKALEAYTLDGIADKIECPILITDPEHEQFWPGDAQKLFDAVATPVERKALVRFTAAEGADSHCEPQALGLRDQRVFDWLDEVL